MRISDWSSDVCSSDLISRGILEKIYGGRLVVVVVVALHLELGQDPHWIFVGPVGQLNDILSIRAYGVGLGGIDNDGSIDAGGLLHARVRVVPVSAALLHFELICAGCAGCKIGRASCRERVCQYG